MRVATTLLIGLVLLSCSKEKVQNIPAPFQEYVDAFFYEGNLSGLGLQVQDVDLTIAFGSLTGSAGGQCSFRDNTITIDSDTWYILDEGERTWLIFHELEHCVLNRQHKNATTDNEACKSIMKGMENGFDCSLNLYSNLWWGYYLEELLNPMTPLPGWYTSNNDDDVILATDTILDLTTVSNSLFIDTIDFLRYDNFNLDFSFDNFNTNQPFVKFYLGNIGYSSCDIFTGTNIQISTDSTETIYYQNYSGTIHLTLT